MEQETVEGYPVYQPDEGEKAHIKNLVRWLMDEVESAGGDGDALWFCEYYSVRHLFPILVEINESLPERAKWRITLGDKNLVLTSPPEEEIVITNDEERYRNAPDWQQVLLKW